MSTGGTRDPRTGAKRRDDPPAGDATSFPRSVLVAGLVCGLAVPVYAAATAAYELARWAGADLHALAGMTALFWAVSTLGIGILAWRRWPGLAPGGSVQGAWLALLVAAGAALAITAYRPDTDDGYYVPNVTYAVAHPDAPISDTVHALVARPLEPFRSAHWAMPLAYDYLPASLAHWFGGHHLDFRYIWLPALAGALFVAATFLLLRRVCATETDTLLATLAVMAVYVVWRQTHYTPGSFAFPRLFQGKAVVMTALVPLFAASLWGFLRSPNAVGFATMAGVALAGAGMSTSSLLLIGATGLGVTVAVLAEQTGPAGRVPARAVAAAVACAPLGIVLLRVLRDPLPLRSSASPINQGMPETVFGHASMLGTGTWVLLALLLALITGLDRGRSRRAVLVWTGAILVIFLNPVTGQWVLDGLVGPAVYWRLFHALPWAVLIGLSALRVTERLPGTLHHRRGFVLGALAILALLFGSTRADYPVPDWPPRWDLPKHPRAMAAEVIAGSPPGPMLAPAPLSWLIPVLDGDRPQLRLRTDALEVFAAQAGAPDLADRRILATDALGSDGSAGAADHALEALARVLWETKPVSVVVDLEAPRTEAIFARLARAGYTRRTGTAWHAVWVRAGAGEDPSARSAMPPGSDLHRGSTPPAEPPTLHGWPDPARPDPGSAVRVR